METSTRKVVWEEPSQQNVNEEFDEELFESSEERNWYESLENRLQMEDYLVNIDGTYDWYREIPHDAAWGHAETVHGRIAGKAVQRILDGDDSALQDAFDEGGVIPVSTAHAATEGSLHKCATDAIERMLGSTVARWFILAEEENWAISKKDLTDTVITLIIPPASQILSCIVSHGLHEIADQTRRFPVSIWENDIEHLTRAIEFRLIAICEELPEDLSVELSREIWDNFINRTVSILDTCDELIPYKAEIQTLFQYDLQHEYYEKTPNTRAVLKEVNIHVENRLNLSGLASECAWHSAIDNMHETE